MEERRLGDYSAHLANLSQNLKKIEEVCDDARLAGVEKVRRIKEEVEEGRRHLKDMLAALEKRTPE
jgi:N-methylhydantoinase B/oxoprolinase/acetone carboxylase alpha subunit